MRSQSCPDKRLQSHTSTRERQGQESSRIGPARLRPRTRKTALVARQRAHTSSESEPSLEERSDAQPSSRLALATQDASIAYTAEEGPAEEGSEGDERLTIGDLEAGLGIRAGEEAGEGEGELDGVS